MDTIFYEPIISGVTTYLELFALLVFGGIAIYVGYRVFGLILVFGSTASLVALVFEVFPWRLWPASPIPASGSWHSCREPKHIAAPPRPNPPKGIRFLTSLPK